MHLLKMICSKKIRSFMILTLFAASTMAQDLAVIPKPTEINIRNGFYELTKLTRLEFDHSNKDLVRIAGSLDHHLKKYYQLKLAEKGNKGSISLKLIPSLNLGDEAYLLKINNKGILVTASAPNGIFYGIQTIKQLLPVAASEKLLIPFVDIKDQPRFAWRGLMLDVGRHFYPVSYIKEFLDNMAMYKLNTFHWHLVEDQGWRIEIKKYPKLTEMAHWRDETIIGHARESKTYDGIGYGGFYTQDQIRAVVQYAAERYITVIPEIEMPGHSCAALAAYPELGCTGGPYEVQKTWGVFKDVYCAGQEETFEFLQNVLDEVCELFPSTYIHVGGDECPKDSWKKCPKCQKRINEEGLKDEHELQSYLIQRMERYLNGKNRKLIGWDEILEGGLAPEATVMSWRGEKGGIEAARQKHDVVMSPTTYCYFDYYQTQNKETEPLAIGGFLPLDQVYNYEPIPEELNEQEAKHILGAQANIWTEYISNTNKLEYMIFPRVCALAEVVWSPKPGKDFTDFRSRLDTEFSRLKMYGINYCDHP